MPEPRGRPFLHLRGVLSEADLAFLKRSCRRQLETQGIPCFALLEQLESATFLKLQAIVRDAVGEAVHYLNDFYLYTDASCDASWHTDTELYTFARAVNAWVLLSPDHVGAPLGILDGIQQGSDHFHSMEAAEGGWELANLCTGASRTLSREDAAACALSAPDVSLGDVLLFDPRQFHGTNTDVPKHCHVTKFVLGSPADCLSAQQVPAFFWPEVELFNGLVQGAASWDDVVDGVRRALRDEQGKRTLSAGFYPDRFPLFARQVQQLA